MERVNETLVDSFHNIPRIGASATIVSSNSKKYSDDTSRFRPADFAGYTAPRV